MEDAVFIIGSDFRIQYANPAAIKTFGSIDSRPCYDYFYDRQETCPWCRKNLHPKDGSVRRTWTSPKTGKTFDVFEAPLENPDGTVSKLHILHDITEHVRLQESLRESEQKYRTLVETMNEGLAGYAERGCYTFVNDRFCEMVGYRREELIGHAISDLLDEANRKILKEQVAKRRKGERSSYELEHITKEGARITTLIRSSPILDSRGRFKGGIATITDITETKNAENKLRESERRLRHLSSQLLKAHEEERRRIAVELHDSIASSLAAIKFNMENLFERLEEGTDLQGSMESLVSMIQGAIAETRAIMLDLRPSVLDDLGLLPAINWYLRRFQRTYPHIKVERNISVKEAAIPEPLKIVIFRILQEALCNVAKHSGAQQVHVSLVKKKSLLELEVQDSGVGFDFLEGGQNGSGIGLSSMQERAELSGGIFSIKSAKGEGTRVCAMWPEPFPSSVFHKNDSPNGEIQ